MKNLHIKSVTIGLIASAVLFGTAALAEATANTAASEVDARTKPIGQVATTDAPAANAATPAPVAATAPAAKPMSEGEKIYTTYCTTCHATGVAGAPKITDKEAWAERAKQGVPTLVSHALNGYKGVMPPKGTCMECTEAQLKATIDYMLEQSKK